MKQVSAEYKNQIKEMGREIDSIITYYNHYRIITEDNKYIITEDGKRIITEQINKESTTNITAEDIYSSKVITHGQLLKTMMKEFDFEVKQNMKVGSIVNYKFGLKVNGSYEYVDYGDFIVHSKEYNEDTKTYSYVAYDKLLFTMIPYVAEDISERAEVYTLYDLVKYCCEFCDLELGVESFPNGEREITSDVLKSLDESNFTFRDILDYATEVTGCSSYMIGDSFVIMPPQETKSDNLVPPINSHETSGITFSTNDDGITTISGTATATYSEYYARDIPLKAGTYTFSVTKTGNIPANSSQIILVLSDNSRQVINLWSPVAKTFTIASDLSIRYYYYYTNRNMTYNATVAVLLKKGTDSDYIPFGKLILKEDSFKDTNVKFNEVFGPINSILFSRSEDTDVIEMKDDTSIETNGVTQIKIKNNPFLEGNDRADYFEEMFDVLNGLTYSLNDVSSIGITYLEFNDKYKVKIDENEYDCLLLNDEINVVQGLEETIFTEMPQERQEEYVTSSSNIDDVSFAVDKVNKQIVLKVDSEGKLALAELKQNADNGTEFNVKADNINFEGKNFDLTTENINITSRYFSVDANGNLIARSGKISDFTIDGENGFTYELVAPYDYTSADILRVRQIILNQITPTATDFEKYDLNNDGQITTVDLARIQWYLLNNITTTSKGFFSITIPVDKALTTASTGFIDGNGDLATGFDYTTLIGQYLRIKYDGNDTITATGPDGNITCVSLTQTSKEEEKKNFEKLENALDIVKDVDIYKYNLKFEEDSDKKHIGFVIGNNFRYRKEITSKENNGVDTYSMISVLWQAVKEQQKEIESLKERIDK